MEVELWCAVVYPNMARTLGCNSLNTQHRELLHNFYNIAHRRFICFGSITEWTHVIFKMPLRAVMLQRSPWFGMGGTVTMGSSDCTGQRRARTLTLSRTSGTRCSVDIRGAPLFDNGERTNLSSPSRLE